MTMTCSTETKTTSHDIGCDSAADLDWCCLKMLLLLALQSLLVCSLHSGQAVANPVASLVETTFVLTVVPVVIWKILRKNQQEKWKHTLVCISLHVRLHACM